MRRPRRLAATAAAALLCRTHAARAQTPPPPPAPIMMHGEALPNIPPYPPVAPNPPTPPPFPPIEPSPPPPPPLYISYPAGLPYQTPASAAPAPPAPPPPPAADDPLLQKIDTVALPNVCPTGAVWSAEQIPDFRTAEQGFMPGVVLTDAADDPAIGRLFLGVNENGGITIKYDQVRAHADNPKACDNATVAAHA